jgi:hypothetical protein
MGNRPDAQRRVRSAFPGPHLLIEPRHRHFADDVVGLRLVVAVNNIAFVLEGEHGLDGGRSVKRALCLVVSDGGFASTISAACILPICGPTAPGVICAGSDTDAAPSLALPTNNFA